MKAVVSLGDAECRKVVQAEIAPPLNAGVAALAADDCTTLIYRRRRTRRAPESFASEQTSADVTTLAKSNSPPPRQASTPSPNILSNGWNVAAAPLSYQLSSHAGLTDSFPPLGVAVLRSPRALVVYPCS